MKVHSSRKTRSELVRNKTKEPSSEKRDNNDLHPIDSFSKHDKWTDLYQNYSSQVGGGLPVHRNLLTIHISTQELGQSKMAYMEETISIQKRN